MKLLLLPILFAASFAFAAEEIPNFAKVADGIYRGGRPTDAGLVQLKTLGVKTDINLQGGDVNWTDPAVVSFMAWWEPGETRENIAHEKDFVQDRLQIRFVSEPLNSIAHISAEEDAEIEEVLGLMCSEKARPLFVHCEHGVDRTGLIVALYRVRCEGASAADAYAEWTATGHSGIGAYFTGNLDKYFFEKTAP